jgi:hypothetical protein
MPARSSQPGPFSTPSGPATFRYSSSLTAATASATLLNLDHAGFQGWTKLVTRPDNDTNHSIVPFKSGERAKIQAAGYTIIAIIGDQQSDIDGGAAECSFKLPNPFYFIE